jgi:hypothetical protein
MSHNADAPPLDMASAIKQLKQATMEVQVGGCSVWLYTDANLKIIRWHS